MERYFTTEQISLAGRSFSQAEKMAGRYFRIGPAEWREPRYDVKTLAFLEKHEVREGAFAHLCKYQFRNESEGTDGGFHFYRICLQDGRILDAVERAHSFIRLAPLLLYIAVHELVHVIRFERGEGNFDAPDEEKLGEEEKVHRITRNLLKPATDPDLNLVLDCFSNRYRIGDLVQ
ncbi:MAG: hypothetical protein JXL20_05405 [Deltaproteobacteria bacterium]|nr:hypothetical protein [Deltaproteobacteria bacterium]